MHLMENWKMLVFFSKRIILQDYKLKKYLTSFGFFTSDEVRVRHLKLPAPSPSFLVTTSLSWNFLSFSVPSVRLLMSLHSCQSAKYYKSVFKLNE